MSEDLSLDHVRKSAAGLNLSEEELNRFRVGYEDERMIPVRSGEAHIYYYAPAKEGNFPVFVNLHGGGFVKGHRDQDTVFCRNIVQNSGYCVFDISYHTAPEYRYPYALNEAYDAVKYLVQHPEEFNADITKLVIAGHSAGGNLAAGIQFLAQEEADFKPSLLIIDYAPLDFTQDPAEQRYANAPGMRISVEKARTYNNWYIDRKYVRDITASPVLAMKDELENFPPVLMLIADQDSLAEGDVKFAAKLIDAGVTVVAKRIKGTSHGFLIRRKENFELAEKMIFDMLLKVKNGDLQ